jgi:NAD(P)-dependent dehydrogenase (short-subunit alcohol dehydrogenase family)
LKSALIFGSSGLIGGACSEHLEQNGYQVVESDRDIWHAESSQLPFDAVIWAQGKNLTKEFLEVSAEEEHEIFNANIFFITSTLKSLLKKNAIKSGSRLVIISSIWQNVARVNKVEYAASKAALGGLVRSLAVEFGHLGIQINAILPGVLDSPMTRENLTSLQMQHIQDQSPGKQLVQIEDVVKLISFLASENSRGINGESIRIDNGWSFTREF